MLQPTIPNQAIGKAIGLIELRNYITADGQRDRFIDYFETHFTHAQNQQGGYILGQFTVKDFPDNFFWMRGFKNMEERSRFLPGFYGGTHWKSHRNNANEMLVNNDNVYLLKPLNITDSSAGETISSDMFAGEKGLLVIDYFTANTRLNEFIEFFRKSYAPLVHSLTGNRMTAWVSEMKENDFPGLPVFQDKDLLVTITPFKDEAGYQKFRDAPGYRSLVKEMRSIVTIHQHLLLQPTARSFPNY